jgi:hypothetical protein
VLAHFNCAGSFEPQGAPYLLASVFAAWSFVQSYALPSEDELATGKVIATERHEEEGISLIDDPDSAPHAYGSIYAAQSLLGATSDDEDAGEPHGSARAEQLEMSERRSSAGNV